MTAAIQSVSFEVEKKTVVFRMTTDGEKRKSKLLAEHRCLGCEKELANADIVRRGLCNVCYQATVRAIGRGMITRQDLMREGKMLPKSRGGRKPTNPFTRQLSEG